MIWFFLYIWVRVVVFIVVFIFGFIVLIVVRVVVFGILFFIVWVIWMVFCKICWSFFSEGVIFIVEFVININLLKFGILNIVMWERILVDWSFFCLFNIVLSKIEVGIFFFIKMFVVLWCIVWIVNFVDFLGELVWMIFIWCFWIDDVRLFSFLLLFINKKWVDRCLVVSFIVWIIFLFLVWVIVMVLFLYIDVLLIKFFSFICYYFFCFDFVF